ncbi:MAG: glycosyltransferase [Anaerolineales bacterium]|nr:glycosyltransferase [Anaerolineales bacterium]
MTLLESLQNNSKTIVSITPLKVQADSRTFKQAASVARFGYTSIVVEGMESNFNGITLPFKLCTVVQPIPPDQPAETQAEAMTPVPVNQEADPEGVTSLTQDVIVPVLSESQPNPVRSFLKKFPQPIKTTFYPAYAYLGSTWYKVKALPGRIRRKIKHVLLSFWYRTRQTYRELLVSNPVQFLQYAYKFFYKYGYLPLKCTPKASLYYLHAFYQFPAIYLLCLRHRAKYIYDAHDFYSQLEDEASLSTFWARWVMPFELMIENWCIRHAAAVVTVNEGIAGLIKKKFGRAAVVIRNAHDLRLDREPGQHLRLHLNLCPDQILLVSVGHAKPGMAIEEMFEALAILPANVHLAFIGNGYAPYLETVQKKGLAQRIHFVAPVKPDEVVPFIRSADVAVVLYYSKSVDYKYSLPNRFFQAIAAELPLLYPDLPEIKRIADTYDVGLQVDPQSPQSISAAILQLMNSPHLAQQYKRNLSLAKEELSWEHEEKVLQDLLREVIS